MILCDAVLALTQTEDDVTEAWLDPGRGGAASAMNPGIGGGQHSEWVKGPFYEWEEEHVVLEVEARRRKDLVSPQWWMEVNIHWFCHLSSVTSCVFSSLMSGFKIKYFVVEISALTNPLLLITAHVWFVVVTFKCLGGSQRYWYRQAAVFWFPDKKRTFFYCLN